MPPQCSASSLGFASVEGRAVVAGFDGGSITSDAGGLLLGAIDRAIRLVGRFAACFQDRRRGELIEHSLARSSASGFLALGYEDLNEHDELRHDALMAVLAGKLPRGGAIARRSRASRR
jgi:hypothetical protein